MTRSVAHDKLAEALKPLRDDRDVTVIRDVQVHNGQVGHVVVCPGGVYVIEPRRWRGKVQLRNGRLSRFGAARSVKGALDAATLIGRRLASSGIKRRVGAVIALTDTALVDGPIDLRTFEVVEARQLPDWVRGRRFRIQPLELGAIKEALTPHDQITWRG